MPPEPSVGLVIGTFAAVPYIHLQLEAMRRFYPGTPVLVHDDGSHKQPELATLCRDYGCDFEANATRQPPCVGDLTAFLGGLYWAKNAGLDVLLKVSRRWLFRTDWRPSLRALARQSGYATFCSYTTTFQFGFRTECVAMNVGAWTANGFITDATDHVRHGRSVFVEGYVHGFARELERANSPTAEAWRESHPMPDDRNGFALWTLMGTDRCERSPYFLWHDSSPADDYAALAREWELPYTLADFADPNQGAGDGT